MDYLLLILGLGFLVKGADYLVDGASSLAKKMGISTLVIGLTIVSFGTSAPELVVNIMASLGGNSDISLGNIIGSNIANILLILGVAAMVMSLNVQHSTTWKEIPFSMLASLVILALANRNLLDGVPFSQLGRVDGFLLLGFFVIFLYYAFEMARADRTTRKGRKELRQETKDIPLLPTWKIVLFIALGMLGLYFGGRWVVNGAVSIAGDWGISEYVISATIIALGTSLPELVTSVVAASKKEVDLAVGNAVGSNIFNIFMVLGVTSVISPIQISDVVNKDIILLTTITLLLFVFMFMGRKMVLQKWQGGIFVIFYLGYIASLVIRG
ncbi:calcium/sodium antiporter [Candidatus Peregrinibacteria bacterium]|nr:calcium/sodium antiporter [Candidatus Peregrinibacteria bacterium]